MQKVSWREKKRGLDTLLARALPNPLFNGIVVKNPPWEKEIY